MIKSRNLSDSEKERVKDLLKTGIPIDKAVEIVILDSKKKVKKRKPASEKKPKVTRIKKNIG